MTAYGVGGTVGPVLAGIACDVWQNRLVAFVVAGTACLVAAGIGLALSRPQCRPTEAELDAQVAGTRAVLLQVNTGGECYARRA